MAVVLMAELASMGAGVAIAPAPIVVAAAGSLKGPLTAIRMIFEQERGQPVQLNFGASGLLLDLIKGGERVDVFASANMEHPRALVQSGWATRARGFARNSLCLLARSGIDVATETVLDVMLDTKVKLGTSTPIADPSGDYAWEVFRRAEVIRAGAFDQLSGKARQLTGGPQSQRPPPNRSVYGHLIARGEADVFLTYCTNARLATVEDATLRCVKLPANLRVAASYGLVVRGDAAPAASEFAAYLLSPAAQRHMAAFGFESP